MAAFVVVVVGLVVVEARSGWTAWGRECMATIEATRTKAISLKVMLEVLDVLLGPKS